MSNEELRKSAITGLRKCQESRDQEMAHLDADEILCKLLEDLGFDYDI